MDRAVACLERLTPSETILVVLKVGGGKIDGLGAFQSVMYVCDVVIGTRLDFCSTPYGPVSDSYQGSLARLVSTNQVGERFHGLARWGAYAGAYSYELTASGHLAAEAICETCPWSAERVEEAIRALRKKAPDLAEPLLAAATALHLASRRIRPASSCGFDLVQLPPTEGMQVVAADARELAEVLELMQARRPVAVEPLIAA